jgi:hypothetical protein
MLPVAHSLVSRRRLPVLKKSALARPLALLLALACFIGTASPASAFWVVNFGTAGTLPPRRVGFAAGMGGQAVFVGDPVRSNAFFLIPHAGLRLGLLDRVDAGWRLAPVPLPFSTVGPGFGANLDAKVRLTSPDSDVGVALIAGAGFAHVLVQDDNKLALSPNGAGLLSFRTSDDSHLTVMGRYVYLAVPTAPGGSSDNFVHIAGSSVGMKLDVLQNVSVLPEIGAYWYEGRIADTRTSGPGFQYGIMLATTF